MTIPNDPAESGSYLLRMWKEQGAASEWRFSLENVQGGGRRGFGSLGALVAFLQGAGGQTGSGVMDEARRLSIRTFLLGAVPSLEDRDIRTFCDRGVPRRFLAGQEVVRAGEVCEEVLFVHRGTFRSYLRQGEREHTRDFSPPHSLCTAYTSLVTRTPSRLSLAAAEDAEVTAWPASYLLPLFDTSLPWQTLARRLAESHYQREERRELSLLLGGARERYERFLAEFPGVARQRDSPPWIASYLGLTPRTLSRLNQQFQRPS